MKLCFDLDNTLCSKDPDGDYRNAEPFPERIAEVNRYAEDGHEIIINTARGSETERDWRGLTKKQLHRWGVEYDRLIVGQKPYADLYVDDSAQHADDFFLGPAAT